MNNVIVKVFNILETVNETELYISPRDELLKPSNFGAENLIRWETRGPSQQTKPKKTI